MSEFDDKTGTESFDEGAADAMPGSEETLQTGFEAAAESSPQKSALLLLALIVLVGGGGIFLMSKKAGPKVAAASAETVQANTAINEFLTDGGKNITQMKDMLRNTEKVVQGFLQYPTMTQIKLEELKTNPFQAEKPEGAKTEDPAEKARLAALEKVRLAALEKEKAAKEKERQEIRTAASQLQLQSILYSDSRGTCMIGGRAYTQGKVVNGFTIEQIDRTFVVVSKGTFRFKLTMQQPD